MVVAVGSSTGDAAPAEPLEGFGPIELLVVQATSLCNLDCSYCYLPERQRRQVFDLDLLPLLLRRVLESPFCGERLALLWHAGEPLTLPCGYYDRATALLEQTLSSWPGPTPLIEQHVQTNATTLNQQWCDCIRRNRLVVGVSIDGPEDIHDTHRRFRNGRGSHARTLAGIRLLQRQGIPFHAISVITAAAMEQPERMYRFFRDAGITAVGFNVEEQEGCHRQSSMQGRLREEQYRAFLKRFWQLSEADGHPLALREFDELIELIASGGRLRESQLNRPMAIVNVAWNGDFSTFDPELLGVRSDSYGTFTLGNIRSDSLEQACRSERFHHLHRDIRAGMEACRGHCDLYGFCGGGMGSNKFWEHGSLASSETSACRFRTRIPMEVLLERFESAPPPVS